jgi:protoheme IX farnesyltransferase
MDPLDTDASPGAFLRVTGIAAAGAAVLAVATGAQGTGETHRVVAALILPALGALVIAAAVSHRALLPGALGALVLIVAAAAVTERSAHLLLAVLGLAATARLAAMMFRGQRIPRGRAADYLTLTKPRIMSLLLLTGACGMVVGAHGMPGIGPFVLTLVGLALACGGAGALNHVLDRDLDRLMGPRTERRPVAAGRLAAPRALEFGLVLSAASFTLLASTVNVLTALLALAGNLFYVCVYTGYLKRRGPANIVLGGAAGAVPPIVGYAAATGNLGLPAVWLFVIVFLWTPPHFWSLALLLKEHYAAAHVPMLPVVSGERRTTRRIVGYTVGLVAFTAVPYLAGSFGLLYLAAAAVLGAVFIALTVRLGRRAEHRAASFAFHYSLLYLALLFVAAAVDVAA